MKKIILLVNFIAAIFLNTNAQHTTILDFAGTSNGSNPLGSLFSDGTFLYGMTQYGGANDMGTIFKIMPDGTGYINLLDFSGAANGSDPLGTLISDGTFLYGMTQTGGTNNEGTIFKIMPDGSGYIKLLDFAGATNGSGPAGSLVSDGTFLYGTTEYGGTNDLGTLFKIMPDGTGYVKLFDFAGATNGSYPTRSLFSDGTFLYGMTHNGGTNDLGTIFKIMHDGTGYTNLLDFTGTSNGGNPFSSLISDGTFLYGMTSFGGTNNNGTIFKIMPDGTGYSMLSDFSGPSNGTSPHGTLYFDGTFLYGMTFSGGISGTGILFKIMPDGTGYSKLFDFSGATIGRYPEGSLISDGTFLYGMTYQGGTNNLGTIFKYDIITGLNELGNANSFSIFPNPTTNNFTIRFNADPKKSHLHIFNTIGEIIYEQNIIHQETSITLTYPPGVYFVKVSDENKISTHKLIIQ